MTNNCRQIITRDYIQIRVILKINIHGACPTCVKGTLLRGVAPDMAPFIFKAILE